MRLLTLGSSSKGNAQVIDDGHDAWLIDCGLAMRRILEGMASCPGLFERLRGILITHEHIDHIRGLGPLLRKYALPVFASPGTIHGVLADARLGKVNPRLFHAIGAGGFAYRQWQVRPFPLSHDAQEPTGFELIRERCHHAVFLTDTGDVTGAAMDALSRASLIYMEANHDPMALSQSRYPPSVQRRIRSSKGHLSNDQCGAALTAAMSPRASVVLAHLSEESNRPDLAKNTVQQHLQAAGKTPAELYVAPAAGPGRPIINHYKEAIL